MLIAALCGSSRWLAIGLGVGVVLGSAAAVLGDMDIGTYILGLKYMSEQLEITLGFSGSGLNPKEVLKEQALQRLLRKCMLRMERIVSGCKRLHPNRLGTEPHPAKRLLVGRKVDALEGLFGSKLRRERSSNTGCSPLLPLIYCVAITDTRHGTDIGGGTQFKQAVQDNIGSWDPSANALEPEDLQRMERLRVW